MTLATLGFLETAIPDGGVSPLAWAIITALVTVIVTAIPALWVRGNKMYDKVYADLKECNRVKTDQEEEVLGLLKVLRLHMEQPRGGKKG